jgi:hypothetical protein
MPNCDFYAHGKDFQELLGFVFDQPGWVLHELASQFNRPVVVFSSAADMFEQCGVGTQALYFQLYAPEMGGTVIHKRIGFKPGAVDGASHRFSTEGWGLIQLYLGCERRDGITHSHTNHNSPGRAQTWSATPATGALDDPGRWDWRAVARISGKLNRFIRKLALSKLGARPILPGAHAVVLAGKKLLLNG